LTSEVKWKLDGDTLIRTEKISAANPIVIRHFSVIFPSTFENVSTRFDRGHRVDTFYKEDASQSKALEISAESKNISLVENLHATGNSALGKGTRGAIPLILHIDADDLELKPGKPFTWTIRIKMVQQWF